MPPRARYQTLQDVFEPLQDINLEGQIESKEREQVGMGSSCDVFRASRNVEGKITKVAVKRIRVFLLKDISFANDLSREVRLWSKLKHRNILPLLGYFLEGERKLPNLVSAWMKHGTLFEYMQDRPFDGYETTDMLLGIASGLCYIHTEHSMVHADLKGSNILISDDNEPLIADFGLSVSSSSTSLSPTTFHGSKGSLRWMAKELHSTPSNYSIKPPNHTAMSDIWAFGMVISELLNREVPFVDIDNRNVAAAILDGRLPQEPIFEIFCDESVLRALWAISLRCWNEDPLKRPSALEIRDELESYMLSMEVSDDFISGNEETSYSFSPMLSMHYTVLNSQGPRFSVNNLSSWMGSNRTGIAGPDQLTRPEGDAERAQLRPGAKAGAIVFNLLIDAGSFSPTVQFMAFETIIRQVAISPLLRQVIRRYMKCDRSLSEKVTLWKKKRDNCGSGWMHLHALVSHCLSSRPAVESFIDAYAQLNNHLTSQWQADFSHFEDIFLLCSNTHETSLVVEFMAWAWNGRGLCEYVDRVGFEDSILINCASAVEARYDCLFDAARYDYNLCGYFTWVAKHLIAGMWQVARSSTTEKLGELMQSDVNSGIWSNLYNLYRMSQRCINWKIQNHHFEIYADTWSSECQRRLPGSAFARLREWLYKLELEDSDGEEPQ